VHAVGDDLLGLHNLTVTFLGQDCRTVGRIDTDAADEAGVLPAGTRFVVVTDRLGIGTTVSLTIGGKPPEKCRQPAVSRRFRGRSDPLVW
jgi:hypothetical protein